jgi:hypothetical protein
VNLSFGLHCGWAIEGAVGSEFKIDASYLSPNVSIATSIERATEPYGVSILVSHAVMELCSTELSTKCRLIDCVKISGSAMPIRLHCVDLDYAAVTVDHSPLPDVPWNTRQRFKARRHMETEKKRMLNTLVNMAEVFEADSAIAEMRARYTVEFLEVFKMGFLNYEQGEWAVARRMLLRTRNLLGRGDGPSDCILRFMANNKNQPPEKWQGVREIGSALTDASNRRRASLKGFSL